jgi:biopolymer transport protein ExbD
MVGQQSMHRRRRRRSDGTVKLNITSMIDMFTLMVVFLLKNYSSQGQLVTPEQGLMLPTSTIEKNAGQSISVRVLENSIKVDSSVVVDAAGYAALLQQKDFQPIKKLYDILHNQVVADSASAADLKTEFKPHISIQGDVAIPCSILKRVMYTCGQAGYPVINLLVYRKG